MGASKMGEGGPRELPGAFARGRPRPQEFEIRGVECRHDLDQRKEERQGPAQLVHPPAPDRKW